MLPMAPRAEIAAICSILPHMSGIASSSGLPRAEPESVGIPSASIVSFLREVESRSLEMHSLMLLREGKVVAEAWWRPYRRELPHLLHSLSKSFMSTAIGFAVEEGLLTLDDMVISFFEDEAPKTPSHNLMSMRVRHLLSMNSGHEEDPLSDLGARVVHDWPRLWLGAEIPFEPGTHFLYNSGASFMLSAILKKVGGTNTLEYLKPRLLDPLRIAEATWLLNPDGIVVGGWGMSICTESIAKFGQLYLQDGIWEGKRILPEGWVKRATRSHSDNSMNVEPDWRQGYGFQFWRGCHGSYRGDGAFGQYCVVLEEERMVVAITSCVDSMQEVLDLIWTHLLPEAAGPAGKERGGAALDGALADLEIMGPRGAGAADRESLISGQRFAGGVGAEFDWMTWTFLPEACLMSWARDGVTEEIEAGRVRWGTVRTVLDNGLRKKVCAWGAWASATEYVVRIQFIEEPKSLLLKAQFSREGVAVSGTWRGKFGDLEGPRFLGAILSTSTPA